MYDDLDDDFESDEGEELPQKRQAIIKGRPIDLDEFSSKLVVRELRPEDYYEFSRLEKKCFPTMAHTDKETFLSQLKVFPDGQLCVDFDGELVASCSSLVVNFDDFDRHHSLEDVSDDGYIRNHLPTGDTLYGIEIMVDDDFRGMRLARRLYDARKQLVRRLNLKRIVIGGRIPGYHKYSADLSAREYVEKVMNRTLFDPVLTVQHANGFTLKRLLPEYAPDDHESCHYATMLEWVNLDYVPDAHSARSVASQKARICVVQYCLRLIEDFEQFAAQCEYYVDVGANHSSDFVVFPEAFTLQLLSTLETTSPSEAVRMVATYTPQFLDLFGDLAIKYDVNIVGGSHLTLEGERLYNTAYFFGRDGRVERQHQLHVTHADRHWWGVVPGNDLAVFDSDHGKFAIFVGYDIEFPEIGRIAAERGAEILFVPFSCDERHAYLRLKYCAHARAVENQMYVIMSGSAGNLPFVDNLDLQYAQSGIYTPCSYSFSRDAIACESAPNEDTVLIHDLDLEVLRRYRRDRREASWHARRPDLYTIGWLGGEQ